MPFKKIAVAFFTLTALFILILVLGWNKSGGDIFILLAICGFATIQLLWILISAIIRKQKPWGVVGVISGLMACLLLLNLIAEKRANAGKTEVTIDAFNQ